MIDSNTLALLHFDGDINDVCGNVWATTGNMEYTQGKFDKGILRESVLYCGYIQSPSSDISNFMLGNYTIDWWWKFPTTGGIHTGDGAPLIGGGNGNWEFSAIGSNISILVHGVAVYVNLSFGSIATYQDDNFHHFAVTHEDNIYKLFVDGELKSTVTDTTSYSAISTLYLFSFPGFSNYLLGVFDEFRISNIVRWTSDFTPPTQPYGTNFAFLANNSLYAGTSLTNLTNNWSGLTNAEKEVLVESFSVKIPSIQDLATISPFRVLTSDISSTNVKVTGQSKPQTIEPTSLINTGAVSTVQSINITNTVTDATVKFAITTDLSTYRVYDATNSTWKISTNIEEDGMSIAQINALTPEILELLDISNGIAFKQCFIATSENASAELSEISAVVDIDGSWSQSVHGTDYSVAYPNKTTMSVRLLTNGDYIINYPISSNS